MITVITCLRGGVSSPVSLEFFKQLPEGSKLLAATNNSADENLVQSLGGTFVPSGSWDEDTGEIGRHEFVAGLYNRLLSLVDTDTVMFHDDDVFPTQQGYEQLQRTFLVLPEGAAGVVALYPFKASKLYPLFFEPILSPLPEESLPTDVPVVFTGAMGLSIWKTEVLKKVLPFKILIVGGSPMGTEWDLGFKVKDLNYEVYAEGQVRCQHFNP